MALNGNYYDGTKLEISESEKRDLEKEVQHLREIIQLKNQEIGSLRFKLRCSNSEIADIKLYLTTHISILSAKLLLPQPDRPTDLLSRHNYNDQDPNPDHQTDAQLVNLSEESDVGDPADHINNKTSAMSPKIPSFSCSQSAQRSSMLNPCYSREEEELQLGVKFELKCEKCHAKFLTAVKLIQHKQNVHSSYSSESASCTPNNNSNKNQARMAKSTNNRRMKISQKVTVNNSQIATARSVTSDLVAEKAKCRECGKLMLKKSLPKHRRLWCKKKAKISQAMLHLDEDSGFKVAENEKVSFKLKSFLKVNGVELRSTLAVKSSVKVGKVMAKFSKKLLVSMDKLEMRCDGRVWGREEEVRGLKNRTVWLSEVETVKSEESIA